MPQIERSIGLLSATTTEFNILSEQLKGSGFQVIEEGNISDLRWVSGSFEGRKIVLIRSGIGKINAAGATQHLIDNYHPDVVIGLGVAGLLDPSLPVGSVVISDTCHEWDFDLSALNVSTEISTNYNEIFEKASNSVNEPRATGTIISGDTFIANPERRDELRKKYSAVAIDMESAAIAKICGRNGTPFLIIKGFSDIADLSAQSELQANLEGGIKVGFRVFRELCSKDII